jgi:hypothetical protein
MVPVRRTGHGDVRQQFTVTSRKEFSRRDVRRTRLSADFPCENTRDGISAPERLEALDAEPFSLVLVPQLTNAYRVAQAH